ncbi:MAG: putative selenium-dependent hydroxylase accessory protein YqeC [Clostridia bacterium]|nr:putative selenium-dependent hydroxylase accessory protein YqeC [Clostridia bacterium]
MAKWQVIMYHQALQINMSIPQLIAINGAGGKTSLMYALAREALAAGLPTAVTTTTHIMRPEGADTELVEAFAADRYQAALLAGQILVAARPLADARYGSPGEEALSWLRRNCRMLYVEADGAQRLPLKYPAAWEPVIPQYATKVIVVMGLSALDKPLAETCYRYDLALRHGVPVGETADEAAIALLISSGYGRYRPTVVLNQADNAQMLARGRKIKSLLAESGIDKVIIASIKEAQQCWS